MSERQRDDWGQLFRSAVSNGRVAAFGVVVLSLPAVGMTDGRAQLFAMVVGLFGLVAAFPQSPLIPALVQFLPKLPRKGDG